MKTCRIKIIGATINGCYCFHLSPDWEIWPNYEVVEFQPWSGFATVLASVASDYNLFYPAVPPVLSTFGIFLFPRPCYRPPSVAVIVESPLYHNCSPPPFPERNAVHLDVVPTRQPPACEACLYAPHYVPAALKWDASIWEPRIIIYFKTMKKDQ